MNAQRADSSPPCAPVSWWIVQRDGLNVPA